MKQENEKQANSEEAEEGGKKIKNTEQYSLFSRSLFSVLFAANASIQLKMCYVETQSTQRHPCETFPEDSGLQNHILVSY